jgi:phosphoglycerate kinase
MKKATLASLDTSGKKVFVRVDFNVPLTPDGRVADDRRIRSTLPTLRSILEEGGSVIASSHLGRPKGQRKPEMSLAPCAAALQDLIGRPVAIAPDCIGPETAALARDLQPGSILLLENLRFHPGEEKNDADFARALADHADLYVNDAFGSAHRAHASVEGICAHFERPAAGLLMEKEIDYLSRLLASPERPYVAVLGGAKVSDKIELIENLIPRVDAILIGGAMAYTFLRGRGKGTGSSKVEEEKVGLARALEEKAGSAGVRILLPVDHVVSGQDGSTPPGLTRDDQVPEGSAAFDIGPRTAKRFMEEISRAKTILWNGPVGRFEVEGFGSGTRAVASAIVAATERGALSVVGGGDSAAAVKSLGMERGFSHISTGGGASLEFLSGRTLPGVAALANA